MVIPAKRSALRSSPSRAPTDPNTNKPLPNTSTFGPGQLTNNAPVPAPNAVPTSRCQDTDSSEPASDSTMMIVVMAAQYASGIPTNRAISSGETAASATRSERIKIMRLTRDNV